ncbi:hypothetical protein AC579_2153 [Pseudocercospora musae]|uniref:Uncharacterized protein n=1 Tax=Pseudocercospora musae TaxID=113226 RepID=A0A139IEP6_9PEZI|nr:hypothetical protein AC579_2153 [Pseudocercospora musae]
MHSHLRRHEQSSSHEHVQTDKIDIDNTKHIRQNDVHRRHERYRRSDMLSAARRLVTQPTPNSLIQEVDHGQDASRRAPTKVHSEISRMRTSSRLRSGILSRITHLPFGGQNPRQFDHHLDCPNLVKSGPEGFVRPRRTQATRGFPRGNRTAEGHDLWQYAIALVSASPARTAQHASRRWASLSCQGGYTGRFPQTAAHTCIRASFHNCSRYVLSQFLPPPLLYHVAPSCSVRSERRLALFQTFIPVLSCCESEKKMGRKVGWDQDFEATFQDFIM